eukprot:2860450-Pyramimonas_sp.AAC.1
MARSNGRRAVRCSCCTVASACSPRTSNKQGGAVRPDRGFDHWPVAEHEVLELVGDDRVVQLTERPRPAGRRTCMQRESSSRSRPRRDLEGIHVEVAS